MSYLNQRISRLESNIHNGKWVVPDKDGNLPDSFNPNIDGVLRVTISSLREENQKHPIYWKGKPFEAESTKTVTIGGE